MAVKKEKAEGTSKKKGSWFLTGRDGIANPSRRMRRPSRGQSRRKICRGGSG